jgi:hypothetical protein
LKYQFEHYTILYKIQKYIKEFRYIFVQKRVPLLYLFIDEHKDSEIGELKSIAKGLDRDIDVVENAVAYDFTVMVLWKESIANLR